MNTPRRTFQPGPAIRLAIGAALASFLVLSGCSRIPDSLIQPHSVSGKPYIGLHERVAGFEVWIVNGRYVRDHIDEEFTNFGQSLAFRYIPVREFWLDVENAPGEAPFFITHLLEERRLMEEGVPYDDALEKADEVERLERRESGPGREAAAMRNAGRTMELMARIHKILLAEYGAAVRVWIVDGELVRDVFFIDFTEGGHDKVYEFIPPDEVWIDDDVLPGERNFILLHELHERALMAEGWPYARAHTASSRIESYYRRHPAGLEDGLRKEIAKHADKRPPLH